MNVNSGSGLRLEIQYCEKNPEKLVHQFILTHKTHGYTAKKAKADTFPTSLKVNNWCDYLYSPTHPELS